MNNHGKAYLIVVFSVLMSLGIGGCKGHNSGNSSATDMSSSSEQHSSPPSSSSNQTSSSATVAESKPLNPAITQSVVRFVYFVASDEQFYSAEYEAVKAQAFAMQLFWYEQFGGTFYLYDKAVDVIYGDQTAQWYVSTPDSLHNDERWYRLGNIKKEVYRKLAIADFDPKVRVINYPKARFDGRVGGNFGGAWMDGDDLRCLLGDNNGYTFPYDDANPAHCMGHVAHEFGHIFTLEHTGPNTDCMQYGFYIFSNNGDLCNFSSENRATVKNASVNQPFLAATPGEVVTTSGQIISQ